MATDMQNLDHGQLLPITLPTGELLVLNCDTYDTWCVNWANLSPTQDNNPFSHLQMLNMESTLTIDICKHFFMMPMNQ